MTAKYRFLRTKSECRQEQYPILNELKPSSYSTHMKFKPFSEECTMDLIEEKLTSFRNTITHQRCRTTLKDTPTPLPISIRLKTIIHPHKLKKKKRRTFRTESDAESSDSELVEERLKRVTDRSKQLSRSRLEELSQKQNEAAAGRDASPQVRQDLSKQTIQQEYAFYSAIHKPRTSILLADFNKNNCFLFSRSKRKVLAVEQQRPPKETKAQEQANKFESFGSYYYGSYMKKYMERRSLLSKRTILINKVAQ